MYWIGILREYFDKNNLEDFKRLCGIGMLLPMSMERLSRKRDWEKKNVWDDKKKYQDISWD